MNPADAAIAAWARWIGAASWQLALFACFVGVAAAFSGRLPARFRFGLWLLVAFKALLPPTLAASWAIGSWGLEPLRDSWGDVWGIITARAELRDAILAADPMTLELAVPAAAEAAPAALQPVSWTWIARGLFAVWLAGALGWAALFLRRSRHLRGLLRQAVPVRSGPLMDMMRDTAAAMGIRRVPRLALSGIAAGPFIAGVRRPVIVLPAPLASQLDARALRCVLAHELAHCRRGDLAWVGLQAVVQTLFWFHPFAWIAAAALAREREQACDEAALALARQDARQYGLSLLQVAAAMRGGALVALGFLGRRSLIERRIRNLMTFRVVGPIKSAAAWTAIALFGFVFIPMAAPASMPASPVVAAVQEPAPAAPATVLASQPGEEPPPPEEMIAGTDLTA